MWNYINHRKNIIDQAPLGKIRNCPICNSDNSKTVLELKDFHNFIQILMNILNNFH